MTFFLQSTKSPTPQLKKCGNDECNNIISDVDQKSKERIYCSNKCKDKVSNQKRRERLLKHNESTLQSYYNHREYAREIQRRYREKNREKIRKLNREYYKTKSYQRRKKIYYYKHREERIAYQKDYYQKIKQQKTPPRGLAVILVSYPRGKK